jgi:hypothetical protein
MTRNHERLSIENNTFLFLGRDADIHLWQSHIVNNSLNGIRLINLRSLIEINQTTISHNRRHGLDIDSGAGESNPIHSIVIDECTFS